MRAVGKALGGPLAKATRGDKDAGGLEKTGAVTGAGLGRAMGAVFKGVGKLAGGGKGVDNDGDGKDDKSGKPMAPPEQQPGGGQQAGGGATAGGQEQPAGLTQPGEKAKGIELANGQQIQFIDKGGEAVTGIVQGPDKVDPEKFVQIKGGKNNQTFRISKDKLINPKTKKPFKPGDKPTMGAGTGPKGSGAPIIKPGKGQEKTTGWDTPPVDKNKDGVDDNSGAEVDADGDGKNDVTKKPVKTGNRPQGGGRQKGGLSQTPGAIKKRQARADAKAKAQADANNDGKDDATGEPIQQEPATAGQPNLGGKGAAQADAQADDIAARKDAVAQSKAQRGAITPQDHQLIRNDLAALAQTKDPKIARRIADKLSAYKDQGTDVSDYASSLNAVQKKAGITGTAAKTARGLRSEAYQFMNSILESVNLTWQDIGYDVIMLEEQTDYVYLVPAGLQRIRELAGV